jgi:chromosome segregation ATPase
MAEQAGAKLSPEARELASLFALQVQVQIQTLGKEVSAQIQDVKNHVEHRLDLMRTEVNATMSEMKDDQREVRRVVEVQGRDITEIRTRLNEGDKDLTELKARLRSAENSGAQNAKGLAYLGGALAAGGAVGAAVSAAVSRLMH